MREESRFAIDKQKGRRRNGGSHEVQEVARRPEGVLVGWEVSAVRLPRGNQSRCFEAIMKGSATRSKSVGRGRRAFHAERLSP